VVLRRAARAGSRVQIFVLAGQNWGSGAVLLPAKPGCGAILLVVGDWWTHRAGRFCFAPGRALARGADSCRVARAPPQATPDPDQRAVRCGQGPRPTSQSDPIPRTFRSAPGRGGSFTLAEAVVGSASLPRPATVAIPQTTPTDTRAAVLSGFSRAHVSTLTAGPGDSPGRRRGTASAVALPSHPGQPVHFYCRARILVDAGKADRATDVRLTVMALFRAAGTRRAVSIKMAGQPAGALGRFGPRGTFVKLTGRWLRPVPAFGPGGLQVEPNAPGLSPWGHPRPSHPGQVVSRWGHRMECRRSTQLGGPGWLRRSAGVHRGYRRFWQRCSAAWWSPPGSLLLIGRCKTGLLMGHARGGLRSAAPARG